MEEFRTGQPEILVKGNEHDPKDVKSQMKIIVELNCQNVFTNKFKQKKTFKTPCHPQTDGFVEKFNRKLMNNIRAFLSADESDLPKHVSMRCFQYNISVNYEKREHRTGLCFE